MGTARWGGHVGQVATRVDKGRLKTIPCKANSGYCTSRLDKLQPRSLCLPDYIPILIDYIFTASRALSNWQHAWHSTIRICAQTTETGSSDNTMVALLDLPNEILDVIVDCAIEHSTSSYPCYITATCSTSYQRMSLDDHCQSKRLVP